MTEDGARPEKETVQPAIAPVVSGSDVFLDLTDGRRLVWLGADDAALETLLSGVGPDALLEVCYIPESGGVVSAVGVIRPSARDWSVGDALGLSEEG